MRRIWILRNKRTSGAPTGHSPAAASVTPLSKVLGYLALGAAALVLPLIAGCASSGASSQARSSHSTASASQNSSAPSAKPAKSAAPATDFLSTEVAAEAAEFIRLGRESMKDAAWFEAAEFLDSAMTHLAILDATPDLTRPEKRSVAAWRDSVREWMVEAITQSDRLGGAEDLADYIDHEIEEVSLASLEDLEALIPRLPDRNFELPLPSPLTHSVLQAMRVFTGSGRGYFEKWLQRRGRYEEMIVGKLEERGMPRDLLYLSMIESGFNPKAWSHASASGLWQFISGTGRRYGLKDDWWEDPRRDPVRATDAALDYLEDLYAEFGDWHLAMAAYNCGEGRVRRQLRQEGAQSYWGMSLPKETRYYIPKILAAMIIGRNPAVFGFGTAADSAHAALSHDTLTISRAMPVRGIASVLGISEDSVKALNPALRRWSTPPNRPAYMLYLPAGTRDSFLAGLDRIDTMPTVSVRTHRVTRGQTLSGIASRHGVSVAAIQAANGLHGTRLRAGQVLTIPTTGAPEEFDASEAGSEEAAAPVITSRHTVRSGETLSRIAGRYRVTISSLRRANNMQPGDMLRAGRVLSIPAGRGLSVAGEETVARAGSTRRVHVVRRGETLSGIAVRYGVRMADLKAWNLLRGNGVRVGQRLVVHVSARVAVSSGLEYYNVRRGDNLWAISSRFGSTVDALRRMNEGLSEDLHPGQRIRVR
jgi:membrane-bound lytic murein transglycosylase D